MAASELSQVAPDQDSQELNSALVHAEDCGGSRLFQGGSYTWKGSEEGAPGQSSLRHVCGSSSRQKDAL